MSGAMPTSESMDVDKEVDDLSKKYGGCEGPDAMYVKLISSDGHEFIVKREHALTSGTIKAMLSGPGQFAENETNEVNFREIPYERLSFNDFQLYCVKGRMYFRRSVCSLLIKSATQTVLRKYVSFPSPLK